MKTKKTMNPEKFKMTFRLNARRRAALVLILMVGGATVTTAQSASGSRGHRTAVRNTRAPQVEWFAGREVVAGQLIVKTRVANSTAERQRDLRKIERLVSARTIRELGGTGALLLQTRMKVAAAIKAISDQSLAEYVEPNAIVHALRVPNDPLFVQQWAMNKIQAPAAWDTTTGAQTFSAGVVDSGVQYDHEDLSASIWTAPAAFTVTIGGQPLTCPKGSHGYNAITHSCTAGAVTDDNGHGTLVSGVIGAHGDNGKGVSGVNWISSIVALKFLDSTGSGTTADAIDAIEFAIQVNKAGAGVNIRVLNNSWGGGMDSTALHDEVVRSNDADLLFVASAGASGADNDVDPIYPASYEVPNVIAVTTTGMTDELPANADYGLRHVHLGAPGIRIWTTETGPGKYKSVSGPSLAAPHVAGAALLVLSHCALDTPSLKRALLDNVDPVPSLANKTVSGGRLNVAKALASCPAVAAARSLLTAPRFIYVANSAQASVSRFRVNSSSGNVAPISPQVCTGALLPNCNDGATPFSTTSEPSSRFLYVLNLNFSNVVAYRINSASGALTRLSSICADGGTTPCTRTRPVNISTDPSGRFVYVINQNTNSISTFVINSTSGLLFPVAGSPVATGRTPLRMAIDRSGKFAYVSNSKDNSISIYTIDSNNGVLSAIGTSQSGKNPTALAADPAADFLYVVNKDDDSVSTFAIKPQDGTLTNIGKPICARIQAGTQCASTNPSWIAIDHDGKFLYVSNNRITAFKGGISTFAIGADGVLQRLPAASFDFASFPTFMSFDPSNRFLYMLGTNTLLPFKFNSANGLLTTLPAATTGGGPSSLNVVGF